MSRLKYGVPAFFQLSAIILAASPCLAAWQSNVSYGGTLKMDLYTPSTVVASPGLIVAIHYCTGNAGSTHAWFQSLADQYGFFIISPDAGKQCFDSSASRTGDKAAIVQMVQYVITQKNIDKTRVFAAGASSGGCMTNTLLGVYPDVFAAGSALPGVPVGSWPSGDTTCTVCGSNPPTKTAAAWGDLVRNAYSYSGTRPRVQQWVGSNDEYNFDGWLDPVILQWTNVLGLGSGTTATGPSGWTRSEYKNGTGTVMLQTNVGQGMPHDLTSKVPWVEVVKFFGLDQTGTAGTGGATSTGGTTAKGGTTGAGGTTAKGGTTGAGGTTAKGGTTGAGGTTAKGGTTGAGGTTAKGGTVGNGGTTSSVSSANGGSTSVVGTSVAAAGTTTADTTIAGIGGGVTGTSTAPGSVGGAATATATASGEPAADDGGCACRVSNRSGHKATYMALLAALLTTVVRRRRRV